MSPSSKVKKSNRELAQKINAEAKGNPHSPYAGKFVAIANGKVVVVADNWRELSRQLRQIEPNPMNCLCIEASADYDGVHEIWSRA